MSENKFTCGYCGGKFYLTKRNGAWYFDLHFGNLISEIVNFGSFNVACDGVAIIALEAVEISERDSLIEFTEKRSETGGKSPTKVESATTSDYLTETDDHIQREFEIYHEANPQVFKALKKRALQLKKEGYTRYSMAGLWEWLRYHTRTHSEEFGVEFKFSNNHRSRYARLLMQEVAELDGFFEVRELTAK